MSIDTCALVDQTALTRLRATGKDILDLLHRLSTQDLKSLPVGAGAPTVLTSAKGRIVERLFVHRLAERDVLLIAGPNRAASVLAHLTRYTFAEQTELSDVSAETVHYAVVGDEAAQRLAAIGIPDPGPYGTARATLGDVEIVVLGEDGWLPSGRAIVAASKDAAVVRTALEACAPWTGADDVDAWRIVQGLPGPGTELNEDWNPLEAGLRDHVSFTKGCYVGQEVVARLNTYDRVSRRLVVMRFPPGTTLPEAGSEIVAGERLVGRITSAARLPDGGAAALGYVKFRDLDRTEVRAGNVEGTIVTP